MIRVTTSWDDGHHLDRRVAAMLEHHGLTGTFYVSPEDRHHERGERLTPDEVLTLAARHEIGAHTQTHVNLARVPLDVARSEIRASKRHLETLLERPVTSFCYPYGASTPAVRRVVREEGFTYARSVRRFSYRAHDPLHAATTVHTFDHLSDLRDIALTARLKPGRLWRYRDWSELATALFDECAEYGGDFHLWGHSWELEQHGHWRRLERVLAHIARHAVIPVTNAGLLTPAAPSAPAPAEPKLLMTASYFPPDVGGLERYAHRVAHGAVDQGHPVVVVTSGTADTVTVEDPRPGLRVYRLPVDLKLSNTPVGFDWGAQLRRIIDFEQPALINPHLPVPWLGDLAVRAAGRRPVVVTYHSGSMKKRNFILDRVTDAYENLVLPGTLGGATRVICSSDAVRDGFLRRVRDRSVTVTPGVDTREFPPRAHTPGGRRVLFIGNFSYAWKGLTHLIEAVRQLPGTELHVVGSGPQVPHAHVRYHGVLRGEALISALHAADVLVLPSTSESESFGMVLVEAMACGVPVIGSDIGGIPCVITDGEDGLLARPADPADLARAIRATLDDPAATARRVARAHVKVREQFDWESSLIPRYLEVLRGAARPHATHVTAYYPPHLGGMEVVAQQLAQELGRQGVAVQVVTSDLGHGAPDLAPTTPADPDTVAPVHALRSAEIAHTPLAPALLPTLLRTPAHSVLHLHAAQAYWPELTLLAARLRRVPYVVHFHLDVEPSGPLGALLGTYKATLFRAVMRGADRVIVLQEDQRALVTRRYGVDPERVRVIPNAVPDEYFQAPPRAAHSGPLRLLFVGRLTVQKRVDRLLDVAAALGDRVELTIVGDGEDAPALRAQAERLGLRNTHFAGVRRGAALIEAYRAADVFVTASDREGMPLTVLEAMATGLPVVASDVTGLGDLVRGAGLLARPDPADFVRVLTRLLDEPQQLPVLAGASRDRAARHAWPVIGTRLRSLYREVLA